MLTLPRAAQDLSAIGAIKQRWTARGVAPGTGPARVISNARCSRMECAWNARAGFAHGHKIRESNLVRIITRTDVMRALGKLEASKPVAGRNNVALQKAVLDKMRGLSWLDSAYVNVEVMNGVVRLTGFIGSEDQRRALRVLAEEVGGAHNVKDEMTIGVPAVSAF